jgi:hypothetical protein
MRGLPSSSPVSASSVVQPLASQPVSRVAKLALLLPLTAALAACYVAPVQPDGRPYPQPAPVVIVPAPDLPLQLSARLYPSNDAAAAHGLIVGSVTNYRNGKGTFQVNIGGELMTGEATRIANDHRRGVADAYGSRGSFLKCAYALSNPQLGTGQCEMSNGARFTLHIGG